jgi:hypothetical protein
MARKGYKLTPEQIARVTAGRELAAPSTYERLIAKVRQDDHGPGCLEWVGAYRGPGCSPGAVAKGGGYPTMWDSAQERVRYVHIIACELEGRFCPPGFQHDHICSNHACVNPAHIRFVTPHQNAVENNASPFAKNHRKTHCINGHPFSPENTAIKRTTGPRGNVMLGRHCLTCYPSCWRFAVIRRDPPGRSRGLRWQGPQSLDKEAA